MASSTLPAHTGPLGHRTSAWSLFCQTIGLFIFQLSPIQLTVLLTEECGCEFIVSSTTCSCDSVGTHHSSRVLRSTPELNSVQFTCLRFRKTQWSHRASGELYLPCCCVSCVNFVYKLIGNLLCRDKTRSQAVARIADCTASQHLRGSRDTFGQVTI